MVLAHSSGIARRIRATRSAGVLPLVAGIASAVALTGAAFYTVDQAGCGDPAQYIRHDNHVELVGGCVSGSELPGTTPGNTAQVQVPGDIQHSNYRP
ncbi:MAG: hypothetical protein JWQ81_1592 [Amycolatopsis sp.]|jgi:hypothetical protein|uniref:hypothetical protein n=1 Tax=Amycolatopsis sp. TaxID=37632 RepID=UPI002601F747|nr:hypothetical protein [Amycolatopsis sp.]MCU1680853.1 hypothetical protein [Amycolatopsis sp.]